MLQFIETSIFTKAIDELLSPEELRHLQNELLINPLAGSVLRGSGGIRKVRFGREASGKRGGIRVLYYFIYSTDQIYLLLAYPKSVQDDLTPTQLKLLKSLVEAQLYG